MPIGYLVLAIRCEVPVITGAIVLDGKDRFKYVRGGVHYPPDAGDDEKKIEILQDKCLGDFERIIEAYSDQWFRFRPLTD